MSARRNSLLRSTSGAVAPTVALSLFGLIAAGGIAFDYARMASLDSELQTAADQAALAAATQLDGKTNACSRAASAASALIRNNTRFANDRNGLAVTIANEASCDRTGFIKFYMNKDRSDTGTLTDAKANFVEVTVNSRTAFFALTPIVSVFSSGALSATAYAGLGEAVCKVPPLMLCNPSETSTNTSFNVSALVGKGLRLIANDGGGYTPGNFGFLETNGMSGNNALRDAMGLGTTTFDCTKGDGVTTEPGIPNSVFEALNTRFDMYSSISSVCGSDGSLCPPSTNVGKDVVMQRNSNGNGGNCPSASYSSGNGGTGWRLVDDADAYLPSDTNDITTTPLAMGLPRDKCHAVSDEGICGGALVKSRVGDGDWDVNAYWRVNHGGVNLYADTTSYNGQTPGQALGYTTSTSTKPTRYAVYRWEAAQNSLPMRTLSGDRSSFTAPVCQPGAAVTPTASADRRRLTVAVVNCLSANNGGQVRGRSPALEVIDWIDVFLVEPTLVRPKGNPSRTSSNDLYVEVIGGAGTQTNGTSAPQYIQKYTPYLIE
ncbi:pilus assembly protein TadG-related protein [Sphingobium agri]|uniref:pilus assembly protein TadG-related protein n=1 Tax=Sphingobium sp. GCM10012300 TaxID=3317347 RepID=UPI00248C302A